jgi:hypothetical protein
VKMKTLQKRIKEIKVNQGNIKKSVWEIKSDIEIIENFN